MITDLIAKARELADDNTSRIAPTQSPTWVPVMRALADELDHTRNLLRIAEKAAADNQRHLFREMDVRRRAEDVCIAAAALGLGEEPPVGPDREADMYSLSNGEVRDLFRALDAWRRVRDGEGDGK